MNSTSKFNVPNSHSVLETASGRKRRNVSQRCYIFLLNFIIFEYLLQGYPTRRQPRCVTRPAGTIVNYKYTIRITQLFRRLSVVFILIFTKKVREQTHNNCRVPSPYKAWAPLPHVISGSLN